MSSAIEQTVKALVEFESELDRVKAESSDAKRKMLKDAAEWASMAKSSAVSAAQEIASGRLAKAKEEADAEAEAIKKKGETALKSFESSIAKHKGRAAKHVAAALLGDSK